MEYILKTLLSKFEAVIKIEFNNDWYLLDFTFSVRELDPLVYMLSRLAEDKQVLDFFY